MLQRNVTVSEILSKSNERITAGFSVKIVINCHESTDKLYEDKVKSYTIVFIIHPSFPAVLL